MKYILFLTAILCSATACKNEWFDEKPNSSLVVPQTLKDFQALLDNSSIMNEQTISLGEISSDDYYVSDAIWLSSILLERNLYVWDIETFEGFNITIWSGPYKKVFYANIVLDGIDKVRLENSLEDWNSVKGSACYFRAEALFDLAQNFSKQYTAETADADLGIPLRLTSDPTPKSVRASAKQTYEQIISDLETAIELLPVNSSLKNRPTKAAANALIARVYLMIGRYEAALKHSSDCLAVSDYLMDYNSLDSNETYPISLFNDETIVYGKMSNSPFLSFNNRLVSPTLYSLYHENDLRKRIYFAVNPMGEIRFKGSYVGVGDVTGNAFGGIATDEIYLIRAECYARSGNTSAALQDLNDLLIKRYASGTFVPVTASSSNEALTKILQERRKELLFRGLRWQDLRRLNKQSGFEQTLTRTVNGQTYTLQPNSPRYVFPIPPNVLAANPDMPQNER